MPKTFRVTKEEPLLDIVSYGSRGRQAHIRLIPAEVDHIRRTVQRVPEVMVKVLSRASNDLSSAGRHIDYISRKGDLALETDDDARLEEVSGKVLLEEWDLDVDNLRRQSTLSVVNNREPPKLIHKLMFSMPPSTPPDKVLKAVRNLAREEFWGQHRYALALHTDEPHPHVHLVLKAVSEQGIRLNIKKATLRHWRSEFSRHLRMLGVAANATERAVRGGGMKSRKDGIYRASLRGESHFLRSRVVDAAQRILTGEHRRQSGKHKLRETRAAIERGWTVAANILERSGHPQLAIDVRRFTAQLPSALTDQEQLMAELSLRARDSRDLTPVR